MVKPILNLEEKHYEPLQLESQIYAMWEASGAFTADNKSKKPPFSIVIPPPNVTGRLHMGHALNNTVQDTVIRYKRMDGFDALWIPGTDHAGISTQSVVKKQLDSQGINYLDLGRDKMIEKIWEWKEKYGGQILNQLKRLGSSCDWSRTRFTMDEGLSRAVNFAFKNLYDKGLIYRGNYIVNWCPVDRTALSDDEVSTKEGGEPGHLWHFKYPLADGSGHIQIATTRPETMLGDTAVCVHPDDERYQKLIGKKIKLPIVGREIPIIADSYADPEFGTGCLKITPAHDPNDFQIAERHNLPKINVMTETATMNDQVPERFRGLDRFECREQIVAEMKGLGLLAGVEERMVPVLRAERSKAIIEYRMSDQWFVKMRPLAEMALKASEAGKVKLFPERWENVYRDWLVKTRDWCISRQIWWGHRVPAWYHKTTGEVLVDVTTPELVKKSPDEWRQDTDVLDTWFSSALWPYSTMGWPEKTADIARYYPTNLLSTAKDIIYFWVARMVMTAMTNVGEVPFHHVYFHPVVCDEDGETMSKSKGNGIDPLHVIEGATAQDLTGPVYEARPANMKDLLARIEKSYPSGFKGVGADALRITLLSLNSEAQQVQISFKKFEEIGRRFIDKLWNATRFALQSFTEIPAASAGEATAALEDKWILGGLDKCVANVRSAIDTYKFNQAVETLYRFFWDDLCDYYLELIKPRIRNGSPAEKRRVLVTLGEVLSTVLRSLHPIIPFITEELWHHVQPKMVAGDLLSEEDKELATAELCITAPYPKDKGRFDAKVNEEFDTLREVIRALRNTRVHANIPPKSELTVMVLASDKKVQSLIDSGQNVLIRGANIKSLTFVDTKPANSAVNVIPGAEIYVSLAEHLDVDAEIKRNEAELKKIEGKITGLESRLGNEQFVARAPEHVVKLERDSLNDAKEKANKLKEALSSLMAMKK
jgi:valyl-tRNA synthetase